MPKARKNYDILAIQYVERYGMIEYRVSGNEMIYNISKGLVNRTW